jgi:hypothetical protein
MVSEIQKVKREIGRFWQHEEEKKMLWVALNNLQNNGVHNLGNQFQKLKDCDNPQVKFLINDWINQGFQEYNVVNDLKEKLLGGMNDGE